MSGLHRCLQRPEREWHAEVRGTAGEGGRKSVKVGAATASPQAGVLGQHSQSLRTPRRPDHRGKRESRT